MDESTLFELVKSEKWSEFNSSINGQLDLNIQDEYNNRLVQYVILANQSDSLEKMLKFNVNLDWIDSDGKSVFYIPIKYGFTKIIDILLASDSSTIGTFILDIKDLDNNYPIHYCLKFKNYKLFNKLIPLHKNTILDNNNNTILHLIVKTKVIDYVQSTLKVMSNINMKNNNGETVLHLACTYDFNEAIEQFIKLGSDVDDQENMFGFTGLMICIFNGNMEGASMLLKKNCNVNIQDYNGNTPIHMAIYENSFQILDQLISCQFKYNVVNLEGNTCLQLLLNKVICGINVDTQLVQKFIDKTILNIQNFEGKTVWHTIIQHKLYKLYDFSKTNNNLFIKDNFGHTPFDYLDKYKPDEKNELLLIVATSYYEQMTKNKLWSEDWENECKSKKLSKEKCINKIKEAINSQQKSIPIKKSSMCIDINAPEQVTFTTFTGINFDVFTSYLELAKRYDTVLTSITDDFTNNKSVIDYYSRLGVVKDLNHEYLNFEIFWIFQQLILPTTLDTTVSTFIKSDKKVLAIPVAIELSNGAHANCIIIDKRFKTIERFEPNGSKDPYGFSFNSALLDDLLRNVFLQKLKYTYLTPVDTQQSIGFQQLEGYETKKSRKIGDPEGFCVPWCLWYIEQRIKYNIHPKKLALKLIIKIKSKNISFKTLIRQYSVSILGTRNKILEQMSIDINDIRNDNITDQINNDLIQSLKLELVGLA